jgi:hypothetical protein
VHDLVLLPGSEPRARNGCFEPGGSSLMAPPSLTPNWISTISPGFTSATNLSHEPSAMKLRLLRPPRARFATLTLVGSK